MDGKDGRDQLWCAVFVCFFVAQAALALDQDLPFQRQIGVDQLVADAKTSSRFIAEQDPSIKYWAPCTVVENLTEAIMSTDIGSGVQPPLRAEVSIDVFEMMSFALEVVVLLLAMVILNWLLKRKESDNPERRTFRLIGISLLGSLGLFVIIFSLPGKETSIEHVVTLLGILLSAAIALSSTTFISNFMAGILLALPFTHKYYWT